MEKHTFDEFKELFIKHLEICNKAILKHKDIFPYKEIWGNGFRQLGEGHIFNCTIYDNRPKGIYSLRLNQDKQLELVDQELSQRFLPLNYTYLKHVFDNAEEYINHPAKLNWDWLKV